MGVVGGEGGVARPNNGPSYLAPYISVCPRAAVYMESRTNTYSSDTIGGEQLTGV